MENKILLASKILRALNGKTGFAAQKAKKNEMSPLSL